MKAWTLIAFYLSKDIWSRWLEQPGPALARLLVGALLATLLLLAQAVFVLAGRSLESRVARLGAGTLLLTETLGPDRADLAPLGRLLAPLAARAEVLAFRQLPVAARDPLRGEDLLVLAHGPETFAALAPALAFAPASALRYVTADLPPNFPLEVELDGLRREAVTLAPPAWLARLPLFKPLLLLPEDETAAWRTRGHLEFCLVLADPARPDAVRELAAAVRALLAVENRDTAQLQSPENLLAEIAALETTRRRAQAGAGLAGGAAIALVFGALAGLEYRQNRYVVALLRGFGAPAFLILLRYAAEALLLLAAAGLAARALASGVHVTAFALAGFEPGLLNRAVLDPYAWDAVWTQLRWLLAGAALSVAPVALALRQPVGKILS